MYDTIFQWDETVIGECDMDCIMIPSSVSLSHLLAIFLIPLFQMKSHLVKTHTDEC